MSDARPLPPAAISALTQGRKIEAIKIVRREWGSDLKDAKDSVDAYLKTRPDLATSMQAGPGQGYLLWLLIALVAVIVGILYLRAR